MREIDVPRDIEDGSTSCRTSRDLHFLFSLRTSLLRSRGQILHHAQLILAFLSAKFNYIHALPDEVQTQAAGADLLQRATLEFIGVCRRAFILQHYFQPVRLSV